ncbi:hypothetical protein D3C78_1805120 [compost metagenome]
MRTNWTYFRINEGTPALINVLEILEQYRITSVSLGWILPYSYIVKGYSRTSIFYIQIEIGGLTNRIKGNLNPLEVRAHIFMLLG